jgi:uncharacterized protein (TIGR03437 family)
MVARTLIFFMKRNNFALAGLALGLSLSRPVFAQQFIVSTVAGVPTVQGYFGDGGPAVSGQFSQPLRVAVDSKGNLYIADLYNYAVREVTASSGNIATLAGNGTYGYTGDGGIGTSAQVSDVHGIAVDSKGNVYIADTSNRRIRKVDTSGNITTFAGNGNRGSSGDNDLAINASLYFPAGLAVDASDNVFVADYGSYTVRKIGTDGKITTVAGTGTWGFSGDGGAATKANLAAPLSLAFDKAGNLYIGDTSNSNIRKVDTAGNISTVAFNLVPQSLTVDSSGNIYYVDGITPVVRQILPNGYTITIAGTGQAGYNGDGNAGQSTQFDRPSGVATSTSGNVYVADTGNYAIRELTPQPFSIGAVANAASSVAGPIAPGEVVTVYGTGIGPATLTQFSLLPSGYFPTTVGGTSVTFNSVAAPVIYASATAVAAVVPYEIAGSATANVTVTVNGNPSTTAIVPIANAAPGIFTLNATGSGQAAALNSDGTVNGASNPAKVGSTISLFVTGEGLVSPSGVTGKPAPSSPLLQPVLGVGVVIGNQAAAVSFAGSAPTLIGLMQVNVQIPGQVAPGNAVPVVVSVGGTPSQSSATIAIVQ